MNNTNIGSIEVLTQMGPYFQTSDKICGITYTKVTCFAFGLEYCSCVELFIKRGQGNLTILDNDRSSVGKWRAPYYYLTTGSLLFFEKNAHCIVYVPLRTCAVTRADL